MAKRGSTLALLLLGGFRQLTSQAGEALARLGFPDVSVGNEFALRAIAGGATNASELARRLSVSKQAAAKTIAVLEQRGYVERTNDPADARRMLVVVTRRGHDLMRAGEAIMEELRLGWSDKVGPAELERLETTLVALVGASPVNLDAPGSVDDDLD